MDINSTLRIFNEAELKGIQGVAGRGMNVKQLAGNAQLPTERLTVNLATFEPGVHEHLHWHLIEVFYFVLSGRAEMKDIEGGTHEITPGMVIYAPPGIAGAHSWLIKEKLQLIGIRATSDPEKTIQFDVNPETKDSSIALWRLEQRQAVNIKKSLY
jgi:mannose-6-phosphate isomerase-like protein (cupin superfamily)